MTDFLVLGYLIISLEIMFIILAALFQKNADFIAQENSHLVFKSAFMKYPLFSINTSSENSFKSVTIFKKGAEFSY